ncbi:hypothetical protein BFT35_10580 [Thermoanaerobacterium thermosaccharolyticum]|uniref:radical SAM protein n=1 Tax=Thermoanaerobacterium thermosaccharolyticum TaxID=1517 RepID=UPI000C0B3C72|nr:radical SAM protein [Thermoanaerobacterium thermosaccharolyticum]PHO06609.1 hypothetical protein BFT35_10580 [Thermoanaerobacterium thermosaccharolyticum]
MINNTIEIKITYFCNFRCAFCVVGDRRKNRKNLSNKKILEYLDKIMADNYIDTIHISGGEPTIYKGLIDLLKEIQKRKIKNIILHTNAVMLANDLYAKNVLSIITNIFVSLHTLNEETHESISGIKNQLQLQLRGIKNCVSAGVTTLVNTVITKENLHELIDISNYLIKINVNGWMVTFPFIAGWLRGKEEKIIPNSLNELKSYLYPVIENCINKNFHIISNGIPLCYFDKYLPNLINSYKAINEMGFDWSNRKLIDSESVNNNDEYMIEDVSNIYKPKRCKRCLLNYDCSGFCKTLIDGEKWPNFKIIYKI